MIPYPGEIVASGVCPQGASPADVAPNTCRCKATNGGTGVWQIDADDPTLDIGNCVLILSAGSGSNIPGGLSFGQSAQIGNTFLFTVYQNRDTDDGTYLGTAVDIEVQFVIVKQPLGRTGP